MKKSVLLKQMFSVILCMLLISGVFTTSLFAAKDMVSSYEISSVAVTGIDAPKAGKKLDFTATENSQKYNIVAVAWQKLGSDKYLSESYTAVAGETYTVMVYLEVATAKHYFKTTSGRTSAIADATVNGEAARCDNAIDREVWAIDASKYEHDTTYEKAVRVTYTFPATKAEDIESIRINITAPKHGEKVPTTPSAAGVKINAINGKENNGTVNVNSLEWSHQSGKALAGNATFEAGEKYSVKMELGSVFGTSFATDASHILSQPGKPFPAVEVEINGKTATVLPSTDAYGNYVIVVGAVFDCEYSVIDELEITGITAPKAGAFPSYVAIVRGEGAKLASVNSGTTKNGITWIESGSSAISVNSAFEPETAYIVRIELEAEEGYIFDDPAVDLDGRTGGVEVDGDENKITVTYAFQPTGFAVVRSVTIEDLDVPKDGASPDYTATVTDNRLSLADDKDRFTNNGITWYNVTDNETILSGGTEKFEKGKTYEVYIRVIAGDDAIFDYTKDQCNVGAVVWGKAAETDGRSDAEVIITATYTVTDDPVKPDGDKTGGDKTDGDKTDTRKLIEKVTVTGADLKSENSLTSEGASVKVTPDTVKVKDITYSGFTTYSWKPNTANVTFETDETHKMTADTVVRLNGYYGKFVLADGNTAIFRFTFDDTFKEDPANHFHTNVWASTPFEHWLECACGEASEFAAHSFGDDGKCPVCGYKVYDISKLPFTDVKSDDYFAQAVGWAFENGITTGTSATTFTPTMTCSRGQVVTFLWRAAGSPEPKSSRNPFKDVPDGIYYHKAVLWAVEEGITKGTSAKEFSPDMTCSTADILTFLFRAMGAGKDGWYQEAAAWAEYNDLIAGTGLEVNPQTPCPRSAVVTFLYRIYG